MRLRAKVGALFPWRAKCGVPAGGMAQTKSSSETWKYLGSVPLGYTILTLYHSVVIPECPLNGSLLTSVAAYRRE